MLLSSLPWYSVGVVLSFYSNEQSFDTIESLQDTVEEIIDTGVDYMNDFLSVSHVTFKRV